jgi:multidrug resistance efflux pump
VKRRQFLIAVLIVPLAAAAGWWSIGRGRQVTAVAAVRGTAVEIVWPPAASSPR